MNSLNQAVVADRIVFPEVERRGGVVNCFRFNLDDVPCEAYGKLAERLIDLYKRGLPVQVAGRLVSSGKDGQFRLLAEDVDVVTGVELSDKGREIVNKNGGTIIIQSLESGGNFDYTDYGSFVNALAELKKEVPFDEYVDSVMEEAELKGEELKYLWEKELCDTLDEYDLNDLIGEDDPYGFGKRFGYLKETQKEFNMGKNQVIIEGTVQDVRDRIPGNPKNFTVIVKRRVKSGGREIAEDVPVRCSASVKVDSENVCQDGKGVRIVGKIHRCLLSRSSEKTNFGVEVITEHVEHVRGFDSAVKQEPVQEQESGIGY